MTENGKGLANQKWFVPLILLLLTGIALSSFLTKSGEEKTIATPEEQIEDLCNAIQGVSETKVMITYRAVPAANFLSSAESREEILGIAVLCRGGSDPYIQLAIYELLETLYQIPSTRIAVSEKN